MRTRFSWTLTFQNKNTDLWKQIFFLKVGLIHKIFRVSTRFPHKPTFNVQIPYFHYILFVIIHLATSVSNMLIAHIISIGVLGDAVRKVNCCMSACKPPCQGLEVPQWPLPTALVAQKPKIGHSQQLCWQSAPVACDVTSPHPPSQRLVVDGCWKHRSAISPSTHVQLNATFVLINLYYCLRYYET